MTRVWEPLAAGVFLVVLGLAVVALNASQDDLQIAGLYWFGYGVAGIGALFLQVFTIALGVQIANRDR